MMIAIAMLARQTPSCLSVLYMSATTATLATFAQPCIEKVRRMSRPRLVSCLLASLASDALTGYSPPNPRPMTKRPIASLSKRSSQCSRPRGS